MDWFNLDYLFSTFANFSSRFRFDKMFSQVSDKAWHDDKKKIVLLKLMNAMMCEATVTPS